MDTRKLPSDLKNLIDTVTRNEKIGKFQIENLQYNEKGEGFISEICLVDIIDESGGKQLELIIKRAFTNEELRLYVPISLLFQNEVYFYQTIYPAFLKFTKDKSKLNFNFIPRFLFASLENQHEALVLENLKSEGFETFPRNQYLDDEHIQLIFEKYGQFHACFLALADQDPATFTRIATGLTSAPLQMFETGIFPNAIIKACTKIGEIIDAKLGRGNISHLCQKYIENPLQILKEVLATKPKRSVILHGDCWSNNLLFKYQNSEISRKLTDIRLIDFQLSNVGSVVCDLSYCFYSSALNLNKFYQFLTIYYDSLSMNLKRLGSDPEKIFPFEMLKEGWNFFCKYGIIMSFLLLKVKLTKTEDVVELSDFIAKDPNAIKRADAVFELDAYQNRIIELVQHLYEIDAL